MSNLVNLKTSIMTCQLCGENKNLKSNTHYLSDFIIRPALNIDNRNLRDRALMFEFDSTRTSIDFQYQRNAPIQKIETILGRETTEEENEAAKIRRDFAVDDIFCKDCEDKFTQIETEFNENLIDKFRQSDLKNTIEITLSEEESKLFRMFFLMQFYRTSICTDYFTLPNPLRNFLAEKIYNLEFEGLAILPLSVSYLEYLESDGSKGNQNRTDNVVSIVEGGNPYTLMMNDFVIQLFDTRHFHFEELYGLNETVNYAEYLNFQESEFKVKIHSNEKRKVFLYAYWSNFVKIFLANVVLNFYKRFATEFRKLPTNIEITNYTSAVINYDMYSFMEEKFRKFDNEYFKGLKNTISFPR